MSALLRVSSLRTRLLLAGSLLLFVFVIVSGIALNRALDDYARQAEYQRLQGIAYSLLAAIEITDEGSLELSAEGLPETRLEEPDSGLAAYVIDDQGKLVWQSVSARKASAGQDLRPGVGEWKFDYGEESALAFGFEWESSDGKVFPYHLLVRDVASPLQAQQRNFARKLWWGLLAMALLLLLLMLLLFSWGLHPLGRVVTQLRAIRQGEEERLDDRVPDEILPLSRSINELLEQERDRQQRYRHAMDDLAHSLKTPLSVLKGTAVADPDAQDQLMRMDQIISYQLQRASAAGGGAMHKSLPLLPDLKRTARALEKVYAHKLVKIRIHAEPDIEYPLEQGDWMEVIGNLLDNAVKYGQGAVEVWLVTTLEGMSLVVEDDGEGFPEEYADLMERGARADTVRTGQGIGLSVVKEIASHYAGVLQLGRAERGGGRVELTLRRSLLL